MAQIIPLNGFVGNSYTNQGNYPDSERSVNWFTENVQSGEGKGGATSSLQPTPGLSLLGTLPDSPIRCLWAGNQVLFSVAGGSFFQVFADGTNKLFGNVPISNNPAQILANGGEVFITSGGRGLIATGIVGQVIDVIPASTGTFMDGYFIAAQPNSNQFNISNINNGLTWDPLDFGVKQGYPDNIAAIFAAFEQLWIFGDDTTEVWYDSGAANFPFQRIPGGLIMYGCYAPYSVAMVENSLIWLGGASFSGRGVVYQTNGLIPQRISNHAMEYKIQNVYGDIKDAVGFYYQDSGHGFYVLSFPSAQATWVYDITTGSWHERGFWNTSTVQYESVLGRYHAFTLNKHFAGDYRNGNIYEQSLNFYTDNGADIRRLRASPHSTDRMLWTRYSQLLVDMAVGNAPQGVDPQMMMRWSDDGGRTFSNEKWVSMGKSGQYSKRVIWRRLGRSRDRVFEISTTAAIGPSIVAAYVGVEGGTGV